MYTHIFIKIGWTFFEIPFECLIFPLTYADLKPQKHELPPASNYEFIYWIDGRIFRKNLKIKFYAHVRDVKGT